MMGEFVSHPDEVLPMLKLKLKLKLMNTRKKIRRDPHWRFCYSILNKVSSSFGFLIQQFDDELRDAVCIFFLVLEALDTIEDDSSIPANVKLPNLIGFHKYIYDRQWHFSCGTKDCKVLMDQFHHVLTAFLELEIGYQQVIEDFTKQVGAGMAKFISKKVESIDDYDEYCHDTAGYIAVGLSKLFHACGLEDLPPPHLSNSMGLFLQKADIVQDYLEDINETPKPRMFWPREIWTKYVKKLEDLKYEQNSEKAVHCLNEMVTNALIHVEDCIRYMSALKNPTIFRFWAIPQIKSLGTLVICYNNTQVFKDKVKMRRGLTAKIIDRANTMDDVYGAIFDFTWMLKTKIKKNDPNATKTLSRIVEIQKICRDPGCLGKRKLYVLGCEPRSDLALVKVIFIILVVLLAWLSTYQPYN